MFIENGVAYAGEQKKPVLVSGVRPLSDHRLWVRFSTGEIKIVDMRPMLDFPAFQPLKETSIFNGVYIDYGVCVWQDGEIDIAPEYLYDHGETLKDKETA